MTVATRDPARRSLARRSVLPVVVLLAMIAGGISPVQAASTVTGRAVVAVSGEPVADVYVWLEQEVVDPETSETVWSEVADTGSNASGYFSFPGLEAGEYRAVLSANDYKTAVTAFSITAPGGVDLGDIEMSPGASVSGTVIGVSDLPVPEAIVVAYPVVGDEIDYDSIRYAFTDDQGDFRIGGLATGTVKVYFVGDENGTYRPEFYNDKQAVETADPVPVTEGSTNDLGITQLVSGPVVTGRVLAPSGAPLGDVHVEVYSADDENGGTWIEHTDSSGGFTFRGLPSGTFRVRFEDESETGRYQQEWYNNKATFDKANVIAVADEDVSIGDTVLALINPPAVNPPIVQPPAVAKVAASVRASAKGGKKRATVTITVKARGVTPTGTVTIKLGRKTLKTVALKGGKAKVVLTNLKKGKRAFKVIYAGDSRVNSKAVTSKKVPIK